MTIRRIMPNNIEPRACGLGSCTSSCSNGCGSSCSGSCSGDCDGGCRGGCRGCDGCSGCGSSCSNNCSGSCSGSCKGCSGCSGTCKGSCSSCSGTCTGNCQGTCQGNCQNTCNTKCNTACSAASASETISNLGANIAVGHIIKTIDYTSLKTAMDNEYKRRNKAVPSGFNTAPQDGKPVLHEIVQKIMVDVYSYDGQAAHDWRNVFAPNDVADADKLQPVIVYIKSLMSAIV